MARLELPLVANVTEAGDIVLVAFALVLTVLIGLALLGIDTLVGRLRRGGHPDGSAALIRVGTGYRRRRWPLCAPCPA